MFDFWAMLKAIIFCRRIRRTNLDFILSLPFDEVMSVVEWKKSEEVEN